MDGVRHDPLWRALGPHYPGLHLRVDRRDDRGFYDLSYKRYIAASYEPLVIAVGTPVIFVIALIPGLIARRTSVQRKSQRSVLWVLLSCMFVLGPVTLALTPPLVAARIKRNDKAAQERFVALKSAVEKTAVEAGSPDLICDGAAIERHYSGRPFSDSDWRYIAGNYVKEDGYSFGIWCHQQGGYTIDAFPEVPVGYGSRHFCTDETGKFGCGMEQRYPREACTACLPIGASAGL